MAKTIAELLGKNNTSANTTVKKGKTITELLEQTRNTQGIQTTQKDTDHNKGGFFGGVGYTLGKLGTGAFSILEGAWDYTAGGIADLFGADEWAEEQFANNIAAGWNQDLDEWYNPSKGMQVVGDVASGISNTLVGIAGAAAITYFTGGAAAPHAGTIAAGIMGVGAAGNATSEAYAKTGELGFKEYAYGALSGGTEMALEKFTGVTGKYATKLLGKETAKTVAKKSLLKGMWSDFKSEFVEEAISEFITPYYQRWTQVDPNAENATIQQIGYAGLVGGLSGALMGGIGTGISSAKALNRGNEISKNQDYTNSVVGMAEKFAQYETDNNTGKEAYQYISQLVADFKARDNGTGTLTAMQKKLLGEMEHASVVLTYEPEIQRSKEKIIASADSFANYINSRKIIDAATGKALHFANGAELVQNDGLVTQFAVADALGELLMTPDSVYGVVSSKRTDGVTQSDFRNFQKGAKAEHKKAVNELFGIDVDGITYEEFIDKIKTTDATVFDNVKNGMAARASGKKAISKAAKENADIGTFDKKKNIVDGTSVYKTKDGKMFTVTKNGDEYYVYNGKDISKNLNKAELVKMVDALNGVTDKAKQSVAPAPTSITTVPTANMTTATTKTAGETVEESAQKTAKKTAQKTTVDNKVETSSTEMQKAQETEKNKPKTVPKKKATVKEKTAAVKPAIETENSTDKSTQKKEESSKPQKTQALDKQTGKIVAETSEKTAAEPTQETETTTPKKKTATKKTAPKAKATETTTVKPESEKTIHGKSYKDFTVEEFNALATPLRGYYLAKNQKPNAIVFAQLGDFYEAFFEDAKTIANEFDLTLTGRTVAGYSDRVEMVGFLVKSFDNYKTKLNAKGFDVVRVDADGRKVLYAVKTDSASTETQEQTEKPKKTKTTAKKKMDDFGEKIGGARKDEWNKRGLRSSDIDTMNKREVEKHVKKENVWKRPNWVQAIADGGDRGLLYAQNEIYKSLNTTPYIRSRYKATDEQIQTAAKLYAEEVASIQDLAVKAKTSTDFAKMGTTWLVENGYIQVNDIAGRNYVTYTDKYHNSPALSGSNFIGVVNKLATRFDKLGDIAIMEGFGVEAADKLPRGYSIYEVPDWQGNGTGKYYILKGRRIVARGFNSVAEALAYGKEKIGTAATTEKNTNGKQRYIPEQLMDIHRNGLDYRQGKNATGDDFLRDFGIKGGEFGNWLSETDKMESLNYAYDALCDLADALDMEMTDIGLNGTLSIGFGSRGQGLSSAVAHYEPDRKVINLTKMKGAGSLAHEWWHAFEDYISGDTHQSEMTSNFSKLPAKTRQAAYNLVNTINYREGTVEENKLESTKRYERNLRHIESFFKQRFKFLENEVSSAESMYFKRLPTAADIERYKQLRETAVKGEEGIYLKYLREEKTIVDELSALHKEITNHALSKDERQYLANLIDQIGKKQDIKVQKHTQFHDDAIAISKTYAKDGGYWDSNCEMLARAFAAYITDRTNSGNDYLSGHSEGALPVVAGTSADIAYIMPRGEDRLRIANAFTELFEAAKEDGLISSAKRTKPSTKAKYAVSETADLNSQPAGNKSQNLSPLQMKRAETYARMHVKGYEDLTAAEKLEVEWTIASGWRYGASESDILSLAKISAQSGVGIGFADVKATNSKGEIVDADAACYSRSGHLTIYLNPKSKRTVEVATLHELTHALEGTEGYAELRKKAEDYYARHTDKKAAIDNMYRDLYTKEQVRYAEEILPSELTAHYIETMLEKRNVLAQMTAEQPTFMQRCINWLKTRVSVLRGVDTQAADEVDMLARKFVSTFNLNKGKIAQKGKTQYAISGEKSVITSGMTEQERYEILKDKKIALTAKADNAKLDGILSKLERDGNNVSYDKIKMGDKIRLFKKIGEEFGIFKEYSNKDISLSFEYSKGSLDEGMHKQKHAFDRFAKMLTCFDGVVENAVGIEVHNRNEQGYKPDSTLKNVYVLASAFEDGGEIVPVKLEVKEFNDKKNTLYIAIALESIKKDEFVRQEVAKGVAQQYRPSSIISISDLLRNVNPLDESFYKYIPKMFFEDEKGTKKQFALTGVDSDGKALSAAQREYFKNSKAVDENGRLQVVYHGTEGEFYTFDKALRGSVTGTKDAKLGFFFTNSEKVAYDYAVEAYDNKYLNLMHKIANGDRSVLEKLSVLDGYKELAITEDVKAFGALQEKGELLNHDIMKLYLNIKNPLVEDWNGKPYKKGRMLKLITRALQGDYDGVIIKNIDDTIDQTGEDISNVFVAFEPEQIKLTTNVNPKKNADIRYALKGSDKVMTELPNDKVTLKDVAMGKASKEQLKLQVKGNMSEQSEAFKVLATNAQAALERVLTENGIADATARTNYIRAGKYAAHNAIETQGGQYSLDGEIRVGDSLGKIMQPIYKANEKDGKTYADFELYLLHWHNIDRMEQNKPVFHDENTPVTEQVTAEDSKAAIAELDKEYPNFRKIAEKLWKFNDNNLQLSVDSGMYSQEYADTLREMYPHYVPTFREEYATRAAALMGKNSVWVNNAKKAAKGSAARILPIDDMMAAQTIQKTTSARINSLLVEMLERGDHDEFKVIATEDAEIQIDDDTQVTTYEDKTKNTHQVTFYHNGKKVTAQVSRLVFKGIEAFRASSDMSDNVLINATAKVNSTFKKLVTSLNPFFSFFKNPIRDMQDALLYTRYSHREYLKNYNRARQEIAHNGHYWQEAKAAGITAASVYDYQKGVEYKQNDAGAKAKRFWSKIENASNAIEMAPRLAEYISAREAGLSVQEALLQAQDVTTNFGRGGTFTKKLNSTVMPFLNPSIQGFSKMWRAYTGKDAAKSWVNLIIRSLILGIGATALNDLLNGDDEEYENLSDYVKEQNYVIALGGGDFLKIPKGRVAGVFGSAFLRGKRYAKGDADAWEGYFDSVKSSVTPVDNFTRTIFSPITDVQTNTTWYGGTIESQKWNDTEPKNRYDESTSKISIWLGSVFNYSPIKIDYLFQQYGGIVADLALPATSTQAERGIISQNMLTNATLNSKWSTEFYSTLEDYTYKKTAGDLQAKGVVRYLTRVNSTISDMYNQKRTIQADKSISNSEKLTQTRIIQAAINTLQQEAVGNAEYIYGMLDKYNLADEENFDQAYLDCISVVMGEEYALQTYNKDVYEKATKLNKLGVDYATYYDFYFGIKNITSDKKLDGSTVAGSKKANVINYVMAQNLSTAQKLLLIMAQGYTITDGDVKGLTANQAKMTVAKYITSLNLTREEKTELAEMLGFTVKNGKIYFN